MNATKVNLTKPRLKDALGHWLTHVIQPENSSAFFSPRMCDSIEHKQAAVALELETHDKC